MDSVELSVIRCDGFQRNGGQSLWSNLIKPTNLTGASLQNKNAAPVTELVIEPGNVEIERGSALTVVAKFPEVVRQTQCWSSLIWSKINVSSR